MRWRNDNHHYGLVAIALHWLMAVMVIALFGLGLWMTGLGYYDPWYRTAPALHKGFGVLLFTLLVLRLAWRRWSAPPAPLANHTGSERLAARIVHGGLYLLLLGVMISGYLIATADGRAIKVFGLFHVPATLTAIPQQADRAGAVHDYLAWALIALVALHGLAALKHHLIGRDRTLFRMLGR